MLCSLGISVLRAGSFACNSERTHHCIQCCLFPGMTASDAQWSCQQEPREALSAGCSEQNTRACADTCATSILRLRIRTLVAALENKLFMVPAGFDNGMFGKYLSTELEG